MDPRSNKVSHVAVLSFFAVYSGQQLFKHRDDYLEKHMKYGGGDEGSKTKSSKLCYYDEFFKFKHDIPHITPHHTQQTPKAIGEFLQLVRHRDTYCELAVGPPP